MKFSELGLDPLLLQAVNDQGYTDPTPVQAKAIPPILLGRDVMAAAQTGTGKTASFTLPMLQRLMGYASTSMSPARHPIRALILTPTRELAAQVHESVKTYGKHVPLKSSAIFGGVPMDPQIADLRAGIEILVATPGRLLDHIQSKLVMFHAVEFLVLDEADRMLDMGFLPDIKRIIALLPAKRQTLLFSATYSEEIRTLTKQWLNDPVQVEVAPRNSVTEMVTHTVYTVESRDKRDVLASLVKSRDMRQVLVFCNTKIGANRLAYRLLKEGIGAAAIHSDRTQGERMQALAEFKEGKVQMLVATDIAARGLDIEELPFVVNFDVPSNAEDYVHRIGRTGRAGSTGEAISLVAPEDREYLANIEKLIKIKLTAETPPAFERSIGGDSGREHSSPRGDAAHKRDRAGGGRAESRAPRERERASGGRAESRAPRERERERRPTHTRPTTPSDPLFSTPYESATGSISPETRPIETRAVRGNKSNRQVPALFLPPVKEKQDA